MSPKRSDRNILGIAANFMGRSQSNFCTIYIVRHGETEHNVNHIIQGQTDSPLTEKGLKQAVEARELFKAIDFDAVFSSDLLRAQRTAEIIAAEKKLAVNTNQLLRERRFGKYESLPREAYLKENKRLFEEMKTMTESQKRQVRFGKDYENEEELAGRFITFLREIAVTYSGQTVLAVAHGGIMRALLMHLGFGSFDELRDGNTIKNTGYFVLESDGVDFFIKETVGIEKAK